MKLRAGARFFVPQRTGGWMAKEFVGEKERVAGPEGRTGECLPEEARKKKLNEFEGVWGETKQKVENFSFCNLEASPCNKEAYRHF